ncbi:RRM domain-containing protein [Favolaschia claudopus]|uniref:RRM domain-containing protein n=1 Tax=Favolaschia claudopus TaxID=2862362 RepID=A0AAW0D1N5_9AGAR
MAPKGDPAPRKPPRRLFSFDSTKTSSTRRSESASESDTDSTTASSSSWRHFRGPSRFNTLGQVDEDASEQSNNKGKSGHFKGASEPHTRSESPIRDPDSRSGSRLGLRRPPPLSTSRPPTPDSNPPPSPSSIRWARLRQHVLPETENEAAPTHSPQPSISSSSVFSAIPPRSQTPKPSKFVQRLGFRQVVEHAREMVVDDTRRLGQELQRACWAARSVDSTYKSSRDQYLPFMSPTTPATPATAPRGELRRPPSMQSLAMSSRGAQSTPSLKPLYQTILLHSKPEDGISPVPVLPQEPQVLATLLSPFLNAEKAVRVDEDRWFAFEAFDIIFKTWNPPTDAVAMERCRWCCKAALIPHSPLRLRIMRALRMLLNPAEFAYKATTPASIQIIAIGLFSLLPTIHGSGEEHTIINEGIIHLLAGDYGELDVVAFEEQFNALFVAQDSDGAVRQALVLDALASCLENGADSTRRWLLQNAVEEYWPRQPEDVVFTPLLGAVQGRKLATFSRTALNVLRTKPRRAEDAEFVVHFTQTRVVPELAAMRTANAGALEARRNVVGIALELLVPETPRELGLWAMTLLAEWYRNPKADWKATIDTAIQRSIIESLWPAVFSVLTALLGGLPDDVRKPLIAVILPTLADRLVDDPPPLPCLPLTDFFDKVSQLYPQVFYKPLFACAASNKEVTVINHLCGITAVARFLPDFWTRDAEMMSIALMSGGGASKTPTAETGPVWGTARLGQSVLLVEMIGKIQSIRRMKDKSASPDSVYVDIIKFVLALETRLGLLIELKERTSLTPLSQRMLFMMLFREFRLLTRSLKVPGWLSRLVAWFAESHEETQLNDDSDLEIIDAVAQIQGIYAAARDNVGSSRQKQRGTLVFSAAYDGGFNSNGSNEPKAGISSAFAEKEQLVLSLGKGFEPKALKLLVTMSTLLSADDLLRIGPLVWEHHLTHTDASSVSAACFLVMQCAERTPQEMVVHIEFDLRSSDDTTRLHAVRRINTLSSWRFQIMSQQVVSDRNHRAFKLARGALPFVATDIGSGNYVREDDLEQSKSNLPLELRKRLVEIGWAQDDAPVDQQLEWIKTPISNLPALFLDRLDMSGSDQKGTISVADSPSPASTPNPSPRASPSPSSSGTKLDEVTLLRRNSSSGGPSYGVKRRAVFVPSLASIFPRLATTVIDPNFLIAATARSTVVDLMRNDPALLVRPVLDLLVGSHKDIDVAISSFRAFLHVRRTLPPPMSHTAFNSIIGFLKLHLKTSSAAEDSLHDFAHTMPVIAKLVTQVQDMSIREIRRAKVETFLIPSGSLWFQTPAPAGPMFPRNLGSIPTPSGSVPPDLIYVTMIRLSQNMLFLAMLKRNPQDVQMIRKSMTRLVLPSLDQRPDAASIGIRDFAAVRAEQTRPQMSFVEYSVNNLSMIIARSYLLLIAQIFRSMSRHLSDRNELAVLIDGLNRILLAHGSDIGIVAQALIALMVASTRFRRLFTSGGGYTLFIPVLIKIYTESELHDGIRLAIEYTFNRFYALHKDAFVFQSIDSMAAIMSLPDIPAEWMAKNVYALFATLTRNIPSTTPDAAGIAGANRFQEREALMFSTADEKPQTFLASLKKSGTMDNKVIVNLPEEYETKRLGLDNLVRLFLTVVAHDPTIMRSQQFLRFFRYLAPSLYHASSSARSVLKEGIDALGVILMRPFAKSKADAARPPEEPSMESLLSSFPEGLLPDKTKTPSDPLSMRMEYLLLIVSYTQAGGVVSPPASHRALELVKQLMRECGNEIRDPVSSFLADYTRNSLIRDNANVRTLKAVVGLIGDLSSVVDAYTTTLDLSGVFNVVAQLCRETVYANERLFSRVVISQICSPALAACEKAASEKLLFSLPSRSALIGLVAQAITLHGSDVIAELERRRPSYEFLAGFVFPLTLRLKTANQVGTDGALPEAWHRDAYTKTWLRLLTYCMNACQQPDVDPHERPKSPDRRRSATAVSKSPVTTFVAALQVLKVILIRAQEELSSCLPGIWSRIALFLKTVLGEGGAAFALRAARDLSPTTSPMGSPRSSSQFEHSQYLSNSLSGHFGSPGHGRSLASPRIVDYALWSFLELICAYRSPLMLQMRLFIQEKVVTLNQELRQYTGTVTPSSRRGSTAFSKPRRRSMIPSPEASPGLSPTTSFVNIGHPSVLSLDPGRQAGYYQPSSPSDVRAGSNRIVHLGPIAQPALHPSSPGGGGRIRSMAKSTKVRSVVLIQATYRRIRLVQTVFGYDRDLLPGAENPHEELMPTWTQAQALDALVQETRGLMEEFEEAFWTAADDLVMVDPDQSMEQIQI